MRRSFEVSAESPPPIRPCAFTMSSGVLMPGATSLRTKWMVVDGLRAMNSYLRKSTRQRAGSLA